VKDATNKKGVRKEEAEEPAGAVTRIVGVFEDGLAGPGPVVCLVEFANGLHGKVTLPSVLKQAPAAVRDWLQLSFAHTADAKRKSLRNTRAAASS